MQYPDLTVEIQLVGAAAGLEYLHGCGIVHGDLKGVSANIRHSVGSANLDPTKGNVLIDLMYSARLADFGLAKIIDESTIGSTTGGHGPRGTTRWMSPEMLLPEEFGFSGKFQCLPSMSTDVYALGMTILEARVSIEWPWNIGNIQSRS